jgi:hypothetical protein
MTAITIPNTFVPTTTISSTAMNANFTEVADAIEASLALDGTEIMTGQFKAQNGSAIAPAITFGSDLNLGIYRKTTDELAFATAGVLAAHFDAAGKFWTAFAVDIAGALEVGGALTVDGAVTLPNNSISYAELQDVSAASRILARVTAGAGDVEEATLTQILDFIGSAARGDVLMRNATVWQRLAAGTSGMVLSSNGAGADLSYRYAPGTLLAVFEENQANGVGGDAVTSGGDRTRTLNTTVFNRDSIASLAANQVTLPAGRYVFEWTAAMNMNDNGGEFQSSLRDITGGATLKQGTVANVNTGTSVVQPAPSTGIVTHTPAGSNVYELRSQVSGNNNPKSAGLGNTEVYSRLIVRAN